MKRLGFFLSIALSISLIGIIAESYDLYSCGPGADYEKYRVSYVDPSLLSDSLYRSFYRTIIRPHQDIDNYNRTEFRGWAYARGDVRADENLAAWKEYFEGEIVGRNLRDLIYRTPRSTVNRLVTKIGAGDRVHLADTIILPEYEWGNPDTIYRSVATTALLERRDLPFLHYLDYALQTAPHAWEVTSDGWGTSADNRDTTTMIALLAEGERRWNDARHPELKLRYGYQVVRLARYLGRYDQVEGYYRRMVSEENPLHPVRLLALGHLAGARQRAGDIHGGNHLFAHLFDSSASARTTALRDVKLKANNAWDELYRRAGSPGEKANLWLIRGLKERRLSFGYLQEIYQLTPRSHKLELALFRELHRVESFLYDDVATRELKTGTSGITEEWKYNPETEQYEPTPSNVVSDPSNERERHLTSRFGWDSLFYYRPGTADRDREEEPVIDTIISGQEYVSAFRRFVLEVARSGEVDQPALWYMVAGYIDIMDGDYDVADECLDEARNQVGGNDDLRQQIRLLEYLRRRMEGGDPGLASREIAEALTWMEGKQRENGHSKFNRTMVEVGRRYLMEDDVPRGILAFQRANDPVTRNVLIDIYATDSDLEQLGRLISSGTDEVDGLLIDALPFNQNVLTDVRATRMMRRGQFRDALTLYNSIPESYWSPEGVPGETACFRFTTNRVIVDTNLPNNVRQGDEESALFATRRSFARELVALLDRSERAEGAEKAALTMSAGDLLYNAPYWGYNSSIWNGDLLWMINFYFIGPTSYPFNQKDLAERMDRSMEEFMEGYGARNRAREFYQQVIKLDTDRELAARAAYMLDLCSKQPETSLHDRPKIQDQSREGYNLLIEKYRDTRMAREILSQCSVYRYF